MSKQLTENAKKYGIVRCSGDVARHKTWWLPGGIYVSIMKRHPDVFETIDPATGQCVRCDGTGRLSEVV